MDTITKAFEFVKTHKQEMLLGAFVFLLAFLAFGVGYLVAKHQLKEPIELENVS